MYTVAPLFSSAVAIMRPMPKRAHSCVKLLRRTLIATVRTCRTSSDYCYQAPHIEEVHGVAEGERRHSTSEAVTELAVSDLYLLTVVTKSIWVIATMDCKVATYTAGR